MFPIAFRCYANKNVIVGAGCAEHVELHLEISTRNEIKRTGISRTRKLHVVLIVKACLIVESLGLVYSSIACFMSLEYRLSEYREYSLYIRFWRDMTFKMRDYIDQGNIALILINSQIQHYLSTPLMSLFIMPI